MRIYLAGPMTGLPEYNFPAFHAAAAKLRAAGHFVFNPAENANGDTSLPRAVYMRQDIQAILDTEAIVVLPGWTQSRGASLEVRIGRELEHPVFNLALEQLDTEELQRHEIDDLLLQHVLA